jgi:5'-methylthioadenosine phosphorylase
VTDYDSWRPHSEAVTTAEVFKTLKTNAETSKLVAATILHDLHIAISGSNSTANTPEPNAIVSGEGNDLLLEEVGSMKYSIMPRSLPEKPEDLKKLAFILPDYFSYPDGDVGKSSN